MRTLKKTLSLVLVFALVLSLGVVAFAGNFDGYTDVESVDEAYVEAVDVMMGIGIIDGMSATEIGATSTFTREQAAKIVAYMKLGPVAADALKADAAPFKDVPADRWSAGYISYCVDAGILDGVGGGNFAPTAELTGYAFAKMLLCAVGYGANDEYVGTGYSIKVAQDAIPKGIFAGVLEAAVNDPIERQQAIQMAFNTLTKVGQVKWSALIGDYVVAAGTAAGGTAVESGLLGQSVYSLYNTADKTKTTIATIYDQVGTATVEGKMYAAVDGVVTDADIELLGRYAHVWYVVDGTKKVQVSDVYTADTVLGTANNGAGLTAWANKINPNFVCEYTTAASTATYYLNGAASSYATVDVEDAKKGVEFVWVDNTQDGKADAVYAYTYTVAKATGAAQTRDNAGVAQFKVPGVRSSWTNALTYVGYADIAAGDYVIIYTNATTGITYYTVAESTTAPVVEYNSAKALLTTDAARFASGLVSDPFASLATTFLGKDYTVWVDDNNYAVAVEAAVPAAPNYCVVLAADPATIAGQNVQILTSEGEIKVVNGRTGTPASWSTLVAGTGYFSLRSYTVVNDIYYFNSLSTPTTTVAGDLSGVDTINKGKALMDANGAVYGDSKTIFVLMNAQNVVSVFTGIENVPTTTGTMVAAGKGTSATAGTAEIVFVKNASYAEVAANNVFYVTNTGYTISGTTLAPLYTYDVFMNGAPAKLTFSADVHSTIDAAGKYVVTGYDANGNAASVSSVADFSFVQAKSLKNNTFLFGSTGNLLVNDATVVVNIGAAPVYAMTIGDLADIQASTVSGDKYSPVYVVEATLPDGLTGTGAAAIIFINGEDTVA